MSRRLFLLALPLIACHDFTGERGNIGFISNLVLMPGGLAAWSPEQPIATGSPVAIRAVSDLKNKHADPQDKHSDEIGTITGQIHGAVDQDEAIYDDYTLSFEAPRRGHAELEFSGALNDHFQVSFAPARSLGWTSIIDLFVEVEDSEPADSIALVQGSTVVIQPLLLDRRDRQLGWAPSELHIESLGGVSSWLDKDGLHLVSDADLGDTSSVLADYAGSTIRGLDVYTTTEADLAELSLSASSNPEKDGWRVIARAFGSLEDDTRLLGMSPEWSWDGAAEAIEDDAGEIPGDILVLKVPADVSEIRVQVMAGGLTDERIIQAPPAG